MWKTTNSGVNWYIQKQFFYGGYLAESYVENIIFKNELTGFVVLGSGTVMKTTDGGNNWNSSINSPLGDIVSISFKDENNGMLISNYPGEENSFIWKTSNGGLNWINVDTSVTTLCSISFINNLTGFICGKNYISTSNSLIKKTTDGGNNWDSVAINGVVLKSIFFVNVNYGWCCGNSGIIIKTTNGGINWINSTIHTNNINDIYFLDSQIGFAALDNGIVMKTTNGGTNWLIFSLSGIYNLNSLYFLNSNIGFVLGYRYYSQIPPLYYTDRIIYKTTNGGINWFSFDVNTIQYQHPYNDVFFINDSIGWIVQDEGVVKKTINGGINWNNDLQYSGKLFSAQFINQSKGWVTGERGTLFMASLNTGISFISNRIPAHFFLSQNYPNPFNPITKIKFNIAPRLSSPSPSNTFGLGSSGDPLVTLKVYDILGKEVAILVNEKLKPGEYEVSFDGGSLSSGIYFYTLSTDNFKETKKMLLIK